MSREAARILGFKRQGTAKVRVRYLGPAPLSGNDAYEKKYLRKKYKITNARAL